MNYVRRMRRNTSFMTTVGYLQHEGVSILDGAPGVGSGRWPLGSGVNPYQRYTDYYHSYRRLDAQGLKPKEIAEKLGIFNRFGKPDAKRAANLYSIAVNELKNINITLATKYHDDGLGWTEIGRKMGVGESQARAWVKQGEIAKATLTKRTAEVLKEFVDANKYVDVGPGVASILGVTDDRLSKAITYLEEQGYQRHFIKIDNAGGYKTEISVLVPPGVTYSELSDNRFDIVYPTQMSRTVDADGNVASIGLKQKPVCIDGKRVLIRYAEEGGLDKDGLIELRRGVDDITLGKALYAQVRINVDDTHYIKGMARYDDNIPEGYDIVFNTKKHVGTDFYEVLKPLEQNEKTGEIDWSNPFGSTVTQKTYKDADGNEYVGALNIVREMGEWDTKWNNSLASQMWSKQAPALAKRQLTIDADRRHVEFEEICSLTNPTVKRYLLEAFSEKCDAAAVELKAAPFPGQHWRVLMPGPDLADDEIYAPTYPDGTKVALIRYPHEGTFAIPILTVRNTGSSEAKNLKGAPDAVAINKNNLNRLSGADCDGDAVVVIPLSDKVRIRSTPELKALKGFDPSEAFPLNVDKATEPYKEGYKGYENGRRISEQQKNIEMGKTTNLLMDMTMKGADYETQIAPVACHSMVIIDSHKHSLNWKASEQYYNIEKLKHDWQDNGDGKTGASTIISRASAPTEVPERKDWRISEKNINPDGSKRYDYTKKTTTKGKLKAVLNTGETVVLKNESKTGKQYYYKEGANGKKEKVYVTEFDLSRPQDEVYVNTDKEGKKYYVKTDASTGKKVREYVTDDDFVSTPKTALKMQKSTRMAEAKDAYEITSGGSKEKTIYEMEHIAADYANDMKALGNAARREWVSTGLLKRDPEAAKTYATEVDSLNAKLAEAERHAPTDRQALLHANRVVSIIKSENPNLTKSEESKIRGRKIQEARDYFGHKERIKITDKEWEAIQAGAISDSKLKKILNNTDIETVRKLATPRAERAVSAYQKSLILNMKNGGHEISEIAMATGLDSSTIYKYLKEAGVDFNA